jgi:putative transposase
MRREQKMKRFKSAGQAQHFLSAHDGINKLFHLLRDHVTADQQRVARIRAFETWAEITACVSVTWLLACLHSLARHLWSSAATT